MERVKSRSRLAEPAVAEPMVAELAVEELAAAADPAEGDPAASDPPAGPPAEPLAGPLDDGAAGPTMDPDADIIQLIERDPAAALTALMRRHGTAVYRYCREELHDRTLADDVHQQVFIQAHRDLGRFASRSTLRTWLFAITRHRVLDAAKSRRRALAHIEEDDTADTPDPSPPPGERLDEARLHRALVLCLRDIGEHVRDALVLRYQQRLTFEELGEILHEKPGTLQARVMRAIPLLRACIEARTGGKV